MGSDLLQPSTQLRADEFIRTNLDALDLHELKAHHVDALEILAGLNDFLNQPGRSVGALQHANQLRRRLQLQLARLRDLIHGHQSAMAMNHALAAGHGLDMLHLARVPGKRSRVIRSLNSADNATSGPLEISGNEPTAQATEARRGGEAKEGGARPQSGEASLQAKR